MNEKKLSAAAGAECYELSRACNAKSSRGSRALWEESENEIVRLVERLWHDRVVGPSSLFSVLDQPGVFQDLEMKGEPGLSDVDLVLQLADAALAALQHLEGLKARFVRKCMEESSSSLDLCSCHGH